MTVDDLDNIQPGTGERPPPAVDRRAPQPGSVEALRAELDQVRLQLLTAVDAAAGAEAERSAVLARVRELEHQHYMLDVERTELRRELQRVTARHPIRRGASLIRRVVARLES